ncbi:MAG TPA: phosphoribosylanthranilate isomerase [Geminicoccaceae bacterium]
MGVKICGLTSPEAVAAAVRGGAAMTGFVFYPRSPRSLDVEAAAALAAAVPDRVLRVGVMVDPDDALLDRVLARVPLDMLQLHGHETPTRVAAIRRRTGRMVMKALKVARAVDLEPAASYAAVADYLLFDAKAPEDAPVPGGNGLAFDWRVLDGLSLDRPWLLAGGLDLANLEAAVRLTGARALDVSSGVESRPGHKDIGKIQAFLARAAVLEPAPVGPPLEVPA